MIDRSFGDAGSRVVLEELLTGPEVSFFVVANGEQYVPLLSAQDHKRIFDDDQGPNTGGMGAFSPSPLMNDALQSQIEKTIVQPVLKGMAAEGNPFRGFLYCGLMLTPDGPKVIEFNVRFGDPEAQVVSAATRTDCNTLPDVVSGPQDLKTSGPRRRRRRRPRRSRLSRRSPLR